MPQRRYLYVLIFAAPTLLLSVIAGGMLLGAAAGALWLFVLGDDPWPAAADTLLTSVFVLSCAAFWIAQLSVAYAVGKREESKPTLSRSHVLLSVGSTVVLVVLIALRLSGVGVGNRPDSLVCADHCLAAGAAGSGMPPRDSGDRTCSCYDAEGRVITSIQLQAIPNR
jgi:hypothetical protein